MLLKEAITKFESAFQEVEKSTERSTVDLVCSGGTDKHDSILPALYSSAERAIESWLVTATSQHYPSHVKLTWFQLPELIEFQVTIADRIGQHRLVGNRFAVKSQYTTSK